MARGRRIGGAALAGFVALAAVLVVRAAAPGSARDVPAPAELLVFDEDAAVERFAAALRIPTISFGIDAEPRRDEETFVAFRELLERNYPRVHAALGRELIADHSLLFTWAGRDASLAPVVLMGHHDVVPIDPGSEERWTHPPFAGRVADGYLWGRGTVDDKINVVGLLEAAERLLEQGFAPRRTIHLAFGHDEEIGGPEGATGIARLLEKRGVRPALVVDEGGGVVERMIPGFPPLLAVVGIAEKGSVSLSLGVETGGGHSSVPPRHTAIGTVASAVHRLERTPMPTHFEGPLRSLLEGLAPHAPFRYRLVLSNLWLFGPLVSRSVERVPPLAPIARTTTAVTMFHGGVKKNVLPSSATAVVNFRVHPNDRIEDVVAHTRKAVDDPDVAVEIAGLQREASSVSPVDSAAFGLLRRSIGEIYGDVGVVPFLIPAGTDARHFRGIAENVYGFTPTQLPFSDIRRAHGNDERTTVASYLTGIRFYAQLMRNAGEWGP